MNWHQKRCFLQMKPDLRNHTLRIPSRIFFWLYKFAKWFAMRSKSSALNIFGLKLGAKFGQNFLNFDTPLFRVSTPLPWSVQVLWEKSGWGKEAASSSFFVLFFPGWSGQSRPSVHPSIRRHGHRYMFTTCTCMGTYLSVYVRTFGCVGRVIFD